MEIFVISPPLDSIHIFPIGNQGPMSFTANYNIDMIFSFCFPMLCDSIVKKKKHIEQKGFDNAAQRQFDTSVNKYFIQPTEQI